jgi:hypothetical protein
LVYQRSELILTDFSHTAENILLTSDSILLLFLLLLLLNFFILQMELKKKNKTMLINWVFQLISDLLYLEFVFFPRRFLRKSCCCVWYNLISMMQSFLKRRVPWGNPWNTNDYRCYLDIHGLECCLCVIRKLKFRGLQDQCWTHSLQQSIICSWSWAPGFLHCQVMKWRTYCG